MRSVGGRAHRAWRLAPVPQPPMDTVLVPRSVAAAAREGELRLSEYEDLLYYKNSG